jgi:NADH:ubiquinone oxidoreductase subunit B-like Fe-S oxidoreductase
MIHCALAFTILLQELNLWQQWLRITMARFVQNVRFSTSSNGYVDDGGRFSKKMAPINGVYEQMSEPSLGNCCWSLASGGILIRIRFKIDKVIPVDVYVPG